VAVAAPLGLEVAVEVEVQRRGGPRQTVQHRHAGQRSSGPSLPARARGRRLAHRQGTVRRGKGPEGGTQVLRGQATGCTQQETGFQWLEDRVPWAGLAKLGPAETVLPLHGEDSGLHGQRSECLSLDGTAQARPTGIQGWRGGGETGKGRVSR